MESGPKYILATTLAGVAFLWVIVKVCTYRINLCFGSSILVNDQDYAQSKVSDRGKTCTENATDLESGRCSRNEERFAVNPNKGIELLNSHRKSAFSFDIEDIEKSKTKNNKSDDQGLKNTIQENLNDTILSKSTSNPPMNSVIKPSVSSITLIASPDIKVYKIVDGEELDQNKDSILDVVSITSDLSIGAEGDSAQSSNNSTSDSSELVGIHSCLSENDESESYSSESKSSLSSTFLSVFGHSESPIDSVSCSPKTLSPIHTSPVTIQNANNRKDYLPLKEVGQSDYDEDLPEMTSSSESLGWEFSSTDSSLTQDQELPILHSDEVEI